MIEVEITQLVYGGDGMGRLEDGRAVFVPYTLPGERVQVEIIEEKRGHARARLVGVLRPAAERITPRCAHFGVCGGCHYQHMSYADQLQVKQMVVREQLQRIANVKEPPVKAVVASPLEWNYRNAVQFHLDPQGKIGFQQAGSHRVTAITECHLPEGALNDIWPRLDMEPLAGLERVELRLGADDEALLVLNSSGSEMPEFSVDIPLSAVFMGPGGATLLAGDESVVIEVKDRAFQVSAGSFFQVNTRQAEAMVDHLLSRLPLTPQSLVLDVYCGVGLFSAFIAGKVGRCIGIELSESACQDYAVNLDGAENGELYMGAAEDVLPGLAVQPDVVLVDPPRAGLERAALEAIIQMKPGLLAYVSCDPATLARDVRRLLEAGFVLEEVTPFDLFPQTFHVETISLFRSVK